MEESDKKLVESWLGKDCEVEDVFNAIFEFLEEKIKENNEVQTK